MNAQDYRERAAQLADVARRLYSTFVDALPIDVRNEDGAYIPYSAWSAKIVFGHITFWNDVTVQRLRLYRDGQPIVPLGDDDPINLAAYEVRKDWSWDQIWTETQSAIDSMVEAMNAIPDERVDESEAFTKVWQRVYNNFIEHASTHIADYWHFHGDSAQSVRLLTDLLPLGEQFQGQEGRGAAIYNIVCFHARSGAPYEQVEPQLKQAFNLIPDLKSWAANEDPDLVAYRELPAFQSLTST